MATSEGNILVRRLPVKALMITGVALIYLIVTGVAGYVVYTRVRESVAASDILPEFTIKSPQKDSPNVEQVEGETWQKWKGIEPVTVLILGIDERAQEEEDFWRTDTMMVATLDPVAMQAGVLSIPRDLWVPIPGYTENRINTAHALGDA